VAAAMSMPTNNRYAGAGSVMLLLLSRDDGMVLRFSEREPSCLVMRGLCHSIRFRFALPRRMGDTLWDAVIAARAPASSPSTVKPSLIYEGAHKDAKRES